MFTPNRPFEMLSMVIAMRAVIAGGMVSTAQVANSWMRLVVAASPAISVKHSRLWSQYCDGPPKPCSLIIDMREVEAEPLCLLGDGPVEIEARHVLRRRGGDDPAVVADRKKHAELHVC